MKNIDDTGTFVGERPARSERGPRGPRDTRRRLWDAAKTAGWVVPLTLLIWLYAEREQLDEPTVTFRVALRSSDPNHIVTPDAASVTAKLKGPRGRIEELRRSLGDRGAIDLDVGNRTVGIAHELQYLSLLTDRESRLSREGIDVLSVDPPTVNVAFDEIVESDEKVVGPEKLSVKLDGLTFRPATVRVSGPKLVIDKLRADNKPLAVADMASLPQTAQAGTYEKISVPVHLAADTLKVSPAAVVADFRVIEESTRKYTVPVVLIEIRKPEAMEGKQVVSVVGDRTLKNVEIRGPVETIEAMQRDESRGAKQVVAVLRIEAADLVTRGGSRAVQIELPPNVILTESPRVVDFKITPASASD